MREDHDVARPMAEVQRLCGDFACEDGRSGNIFWSLLAYHRKYTLRLACAMELMAPGERKYAAGAWAEMRDFLCKNEHEYQPYLDVYRVLDVTAKFTGFPLNKEQTKSMDGFPPNEDPAANEGK